MTTDLVLIGGGHSHAIALKLWGMNPLPDVRLILISDTAYTPYSGMLPGHVAVFYRYDETHIDLRRLARFAQAQFYLDKAIGLELAKNQVICQNHPLISFDYLSIDIGSTPSTVAIPGAQEYAIAAKPVPQFLEAWNHIIITVKNHPQIPITISIVGGGVGGVELALNVQSRLQQILQNNQQLPENLILNLLHRDQQLLTGHNAWVRQRLQQILSDRGIQIYLSENVTQIIDKHHQKYQLICESGLAIDSNYIFWVTQASAPDWIKASGLATDSKGFILVSNTLQSLSHPHIFAAGDIATIQDYPRPKAGVFAVRQGKPLFKNLQNIILKQPLKKYFPQKHYLSLIGTGDKKAIASWYFLGCESPLLWYWKDHIDRQFMQRLILL